MLYGGRVGAGVFVAERDWMGMRSDGPPLGLNFWRLVEGFARRRKG